MGPPLTSGRWWQLVTILLLLYAFLLHTYSASRPLDNDEGFYASAARLVAEGHAPYRDFFYPQAPLLPYVYGGVHALPPCSLWRLRQLSVFFGAATVFAWCFFLGREFRGRLRVAFAGLTALLLNPYFISWNVLVKWHALTNLLISVTLVLLYFAFQSGSRLLYSLAGAASGLVWSVRLLYAPLLPVVVLFLLVRGVWLGKGWKALQCPAAYAIGALFTSLPTAVFFARDPDAFLFNNIGYHTVRAAVKLSAWEHCKTAIRYGVLVLGEHPFLALEAALAIGGTLLVLYRRARFAAEPVASWYILDGLLCVVLLSASLYPIPLYRQYFTAPLTPFLFPLLMVALASLPVRPWALLVGLLAVLTPLACWEVPRQAQQHSWHPVWSWSSFRDVSDYVREHTAKGDVVMAFWPGHVFESGRQYFPGLENNFALRVSQKLCAADRRRFHVPDAEQLLGAVEAREPSMVLWAPYWKANFEECVSKEQKERFFALLASKYHLAKTVDTIRIYER